MERILLETSEKLLQEKGTGPRQTLTREMRNQFSRRIPTMPRLQKNKNEKKKKTHRSHAHDNNSLTRLRPVHTFSIVARDPKTGEIGVAGQSHWFSGGAEVPWAEAGVGAVATQCFRY